MVANFERLIFDEPINKQLCVCDPAKIVSTDMPFFFLIDKVRSHFETRYVATTVLQPITIPQSSLTLQYR